MSGEFCSQKRLFAVGVSSVLLAVSALRVFADTTNDRWIYVPGLTSEEQAIKESVKGHATGVITNGDWRLFAILSGTTNLEINVYKGGWSAKPDSQSSWIAGAGRLDLSLPVFSEDGTTQYCFPSLQPNCFRAGAKVTEFIAPRTVTSIGSYIFYLNGGSLTNLVIDCPNLTSLGKGIVYSQTKLKALTLKCPKLKTLDVDAFRNDVNLSEWHLDLSGVSQYSNYAFYNVKFSDVTAEDFNLANVTNVGSYALYGSNSNGLRGDILQMDKLQHVGEKGLCNAVYDVMDLGYDSLTALDGKAIFGADARTIVLGTGANPLTIAAGAIPSSCHKLYFRGGVPMVEPGAIVSEGTLWTTILVSANEPGWRKLPYRKLQGDELYYFRTRFPDIPERRLIGLLPMGSWGNGSDVFLAYGDYRTEESRLYVVVDERYAAQCPVVPAAGMYASDYPAGTRVVLTAPDDVIQVGDFKVKASKFVVSEIDDDGRWTKNVTTNSYVVGAENAVTMPAKGSLRIEWIFDEAYSVKLAPRLTAWYPEQVTYQGADVPEELWVDEGQTCTFVARAETDELPKTRFLRWEGDIGDAEPTNPTLVLAPTNGVKVKAVFAHDWYIADPPAASGSDATMTDGNWVLKIRRMADAEGQRQIKVGRKYDDTAIVRGEGPMDLSTRVTDADGNEYVIHTLEYGAFRPNYCGNPAQNACTDFTAPTTLVKLGQFLFYGADTALTNVTLNCPELMETDSQSFMLCKKIRRLYFSAPKLQNIPNGGYWAGYFCSCSSLDDVYLDLPMLKQLPMKFMNEAPMKGTDCSNWHLESVTNVLDYCMGFKSTGPRGELRLPSLEAMTGSQHFANRSGITKLVLGSGKLRLMGSQGGTPDHAGSLELGRPENSLSDMTGLRHIELGLAPDAVIPDGVFKNLGQDKVTNLTFTAAPPSNTNIFAAVAKATTVPADGTKTVRVWANWDNPGWREGGEFAATAAGLGILGLGDLTDAERGAYGTLTSKERKRWMGLVYGVKRFGWLFHYGDLPHGLMLLVK